ncbi:hypothetical protein ACWEGE_21380 [Amycolatopsis sp. NPDC004747]
MHCGPHRFRGGAPRVAAPILAPDGRIVAALGVLSPAPGELPRLRPLVTTAAAEAGREPADSLRGR